MGSPGIEPGYRPPKGRMLPFHHEPTLRLPDGEQASQREADPSAFTSEHGGDGI